MTSDKSEYIGNWLFRANEDIAVIHSLTSIDLEFYTSTICFHAQQAVEKFLKAFLIYHNKEIERTHNLYYLQKKCSEINNSIGRIDLKELNFFGISVRYPDEFYIPSVEEAKEYISIAQKIESLVISIVLEGK